MNGYEVAFRSLDDATTSPTIIAPQGGSAYFMLGPLNTTHQHAVLAGDGERFSCVFRAVEVNTSCPAFSFQIFSFVPLLFDKRVFNVTSIDKLKNTNTLPFPL